MIQRSLQDPLAELLLGGEVKYGSTVQVTAGPDGLVVGGRVSASARTRPADAPLQ